MSAAGLAVALAPLALPPPTPAGEPAAHLAAVTDGLGHVEARAAAAEAALGTALDRFGELHLGWDHAPDGSALHPFAELHFPAPADPAPARAALDAALSRAGIVHAGIRPLSAADIAAREAEWAAEERAFSHEVALAFDLAPHADLSAALAFRQDASDLCHAAILGAGIGAWRGASAGGGEMLVVFATHDPDRVEALIRARLTGTPWAGLKAIRRRRL